MYDETAFSPRIYQILRPPISAADKENQNERHRMPNNAFATTMERSREGRESTLQSITQEQAPPHPWGKLYPAQVE